MTWNDRRSDWVKQDEDARSPFDVDYARIVHSASFRRLQGKTQILNLGDSDFYRTRLTHSLEVAQIAGGIGRQFSMDYVDKPESRHIPDASLIQAIGFAHDLGHPPFGHGGEVALNYCMRNDGGFEGNGQTLRILSKLETFSKQDGADLTRRTLLGVLKYPTSYSVVRNAAIQPCLDKRPTSIRIIDRKKSKPPKCFLDTEQGVVDWILEPLIATDRRNFQEVVRKPGSHHKSMHKSFDCSIMDVADDIAYGVHDLEDAIALGLISKENFRHFVPEENCPTFLHILRTKYPSEAASDNFYDYFVASLFGDSAIRKRFIGRLVHHFITNIEIKMIDEFSEPFLQYRATLKNDHREFLKNLQALVREEVIKSPSVQHLEFKGQKMVVSVFEALQSDPKSFLPNDAFSRYENSGGNDRIICDHVAGMTDDFLLKTYDRLFSPRMGSVFDKL